ncbi:Outer membrane protein TolC [Goodfellowiella coeruleoviolacea]|uniref:Outer membrane protein TolC n=1 Tax=Goodfellowiella coeruleoviolacea TaxID=334858 RepID=A0AAE3GH94_9PSEU|nr:Outer membrane protein TolC [Goodfellowiella coeruleoviolacea]
MSFHRGDSKMGDLPQRVRPDPDGRFTADVHVTPDGHARIGNRLYSPEEFADLLRRSGNYDGRPVRLIGCDAGSNDFARRLSRALDTEVLAPNRAAWSDTDGRVFASEPEIGPNGERRPKIPPNGEWQVHRPDGTTTRAGDDGFVPGTRDADKVGLDPHTARDRGDDPEKANVEKVHKKIEAKLNGPRAEAEKFYRQYWNGSFDSNNPHPTRNAAGMKGKIDGVQVPPIGRNEDGSFFVKKLEQAEVKATESGSRDSLSPEQRWAADRLVHMRPGIQSRYDDADGPFAIERADKKVREAEEELKTAEDSGNDASIREAKKELAQAREHRAEAPVKAAEAKLAAAREAQEGAVTSRRYAAESDPWMADADPKRVREAGEDAALARKYTAAAQVKEAELDVAKARRDHAAARVKEAEKDLDQARTSRRSTDKAEADLAAVRKEHADAEARVKRAEADLDAARRAEADFNAKYAEAERAHRAAARHDDLEAEIRRAEQVVGDARARRAEAQRDLDAAPPADRARAEAALREVEADLAAARKQEWRAQAEHHLAQQGLPARTAASGDKDTPNDGQPGPVSPEELRAEHGIMRSERGEYIGQFAMNHRVADLNAQRPPDRAFTLVEELPDRGAGHLDGVFEAPHDTYGKEYRIYEAKGPEADRGHAGGYEQGHPQYLDNMLENLHRRAEENYNAIRDAKNIADPVARKQELDRLRAKFKTDDLDALQAEFDAEKRKAQELRDARNADLADKERTGTLGERVRYFQAKAQVEPSERGLKSQYKGYQEDEFDLDL